MQTFSVIPLTILPGRLSKQHSFLVENLLAQKQSYVRFVSHEIRSPLSVVVAGLEMLTQKLTAKVLEDESLRENLELTQDISEASETAINIVNDLLEYESLDAGMLKIETERMSPQKLIRTKTLAMIAKRNNQNLVVIPADCLPNHFVSADVYRIDQVVRNLVTNACKFTPSGGTITVKAEIKFAVSTSEFPTLARNEQVGIMRISVADTGAGIKLENQTHVFNQFAQFDRNHLQSGGGSGLGLWISSKIVSAHKAKLEVHKIVCLRCSILT
jgi:signal transduction histidine kinase